MLLQIRMLKSTEEVWIFGPGGEEEVADLFAPESHLGSSEQIVDNSVSLARELCSKY